MKRKKVTVTPAAIQAAVRRNTKASARLEGREVPADYVRSPAVEQYIAECWTRTADTRVPHGETDRTQVQSEMIQSGADHHAPERDQMLDDPTTD